MTAYLNRASGIQRSFLTWVELLRYRAEHQPDQIAFTFLQDGETEAGKLSYQDLDQQAQAIAATLQSLAQPGERALLLYPSGLEFIAAFFGCLYAGVVAVPAYPPRANQNFLRLQTIVADAEATIALTTQALMENLQQRWTEDPHASTLNWLATNTVDADSLWKEPALTGDSLAFLQYTSGSTGHPKGVMVSHQNLLHNEQMIQQAFGHGTQTVSLGWLPLFHDMGLVGNVLQPLYLGLSCTLMSPVDFLQKPFRWLNAISRYRATSSGGPNFAYDLCVRKITAEQLQQLDLSCWTVAFTGAEPIRAATLERFAETFAPCGFCPEAFYPCYGMAEATLFITGGLPGKSPVIQTIQSQPLLQNQVLLASSKSIETQKIVGCGKVWDNQTLAIVNPSTLTPCGAAEVGEIWVRGKSVAQGYWNKPEQTQQTFQAYTTTNEGPFLRTGDLGFLLEGELFVTGRLKDVVIIRGRNHYPQDIEATVEQCHALIRKPGCVAAFSVDIAGEEKLVIVAEVERRYRERRQSRKAKSLSEERRRLSDRRNSESDAETQQRFDTAAVFTAIRQAISTQHQLQVYAIRLIRTGSIPKTSSGKIQRHACRTGFIAGALDDVGSWTYGSDERAEATPFHCIELDELLTKSVLEQHTLIQEWLVTQVSARLKINAQMINPAESITRYGLDSIQTVSLAADLETWLRCSLPATLLEEECSIAKLSQTLTTQLGSNQTTEKPSSNGVSRIVWSIAKPIYHHWFELQVSGLEHLPQDCPYLLAANHTSHLDVGVVASALFDQVDQIASLGAKDYFFKYPLQGWFFRTFLNVLPFDRVGNFLDALHECQRVLAPRSPILMFPEGTRSTTGKLQPFQAGLGLLALRLEVPIVPIYISGADQALPKGRWRPRKHPISVTFGTPIEVTTQRANLNDREQCQQIVDQVYSIIVRLKQ